MFRRWIACVFCALFIGALSLTAGCGIGADDDFDRQTVEQEVKSVPHPTYDLAECCGDNYELCDGRRNSCEACGGYYHPNGLCINVASRCLERACPWCFPALRSSSV